MEAYSLHPQMVLPIQVAEAVVITQVMTMAQVLLVQEALVVL